jgi:hypothetical protein
MRRIQFIRNGTETRQIVIEACAALILTVYKKGRRWLIERSSAMQRASNEFLEGFTPSPIQGAQRANQPTEREVDCLIPFF